jgi:hypothetical protein
MKKTNKRASLSPPEQIGFLQRKWVRIALRIGGAALVTFIGLYVWGLYLIRTAPLGGYNVVGFDYTDHPIFTFNIGKAWGGNTFAYRHGGGGGTTCCLTLDRHATSVTVTWQLDFTAEQVRKLPIEQQKHLPVIRYEKIVPLPVITNPSAGYIGVHFFPNQEVKLTFSEHIPRPIQPIEEKLP